MFSPQEGMGEGRNSGLMDHLGPGFTIKSAKHPNNIGTELDSYGKLDHGVTRVPHWSGKERGVVLDPVSTNSSLRSVRILQVRLRVFVQAENVQRLT